MDISYKIWLELADFKLNESKLTLRRDSLMNAIYLDTLSESQMARASALNSSSSTTSTTSTSTSTTQTKQEPEEEEENSSTISFSTLDSTLREKIVDECKHLFDNHFNQAIQSLNLLENEFSEREALSSLRSIMSLMKKSI